MKSLVKSFLEFYLLVFYFFEFFKKKLKRLGNEILGDALVRLAYNEEKVHYDLVLRYSRDNSSHNKLRRLFEYSLLLEGLVLEREMSRTEKHIGYLKLTCPFTKLTMEAETQGLCLPLKVNFTFFFSFL